MIIGLRNLLGFLSVFNILLFGIAILNGLSNGNSEGVIGCLVIIGLNVFVISILTEITDNFTFGKRVGDQWLHAWTNVFVNGNCLTVYAPNISGYCFWNPLWWVGLMTVRVEFSPDKIRIRSQGKSCDLLMEPGIPVSIQMRHTGRKLEIFLLFGLREYVIATLPDHRRAHQLLETLEVVSSIFLSYVKTEVRISGTVVLKRGTPDPRLMELMRNCSTEKEVALLSSEGKRARGSLLNQSGVSTVQGKQ